jgi:hypothetical protein
MFLSKTWTLEIHVSNDKPVRIEEIPDSFKDETISKLKAAMIDQNKLVEFNDGIIVVRGHYITYYTMR